MLDFSVASCFTDYKLSFSDKTDSVNKEDFIFSISSSFPPICTKRTIKCRVGSLQLTVKFPQLVVV